MASTKFDQPSNRSISKRQNVPPPGGRKNGAKSATRRPVRAELKCIEPSIIQCPAQLRLEARAAAESARDTRCVRGAGAYTARGCFLRRASVLRPGETLFNYEPQETDLFISG